LIKQILVAQLQVKQKILNSMLANRSIDQRRIYWKNVGPDPKMSFTVFVNFHTL